MALSGGALARLREKRRKAREAALVREAEANAKVDLMADELHAEMRSVFDAARRLSAEREGVDEPTIPMPVGPPRKKRKRSKNMKKSTAPPVLQAIEAEAKERRRTQMASPEKPSKTEPWPTPDPRHEPFREFQRLADRMSWELGVDYVVECVIPGTLWADRFHPDNLRISKASDAKARAMARRPLLDWVHPPLCGGEWRHEKHERPPAGTLDALTDAGYSPEDAEAIVAAAILHRARLQIIRQRVAERQRG